MSNNIVTYKPYSKGTEQQISSSIISLDNIDDTTFSTFTTNNQGIFNLNKNNENISTQRDMYNLSTVMYDRNSFLKIIDNKFKYFIPATSNTVPTDTSESIELTNNIPDKFYAFNEIGTVNIMTSTGFNMLLSPKRTSRAILQNDGNFVVYMNLNGKEIYDINGQLISGSSEIAIWGNGWSQYPGDFFIPKYQNADVIGTPYISINTGGGISLQTIQSNSLLPITNTDSWISNFQGIQIGRWISWDDIQQLNINYPNDSKLQEYVNNTPDTDDWTTIWGTPQEQIYGNVTPVTYLQLTDTGYLNLIDRGTLLWTSNKI